MCTDFSEGIRLPGSVRNFLSERGYRLGIHKPPYNSVNSVTKYRDMITSHSDTRGGGLAARIGGGALTDDAKWDEAESVLGETAHIIQNQPQEGAPVINSNVSEKYLIDKVLDNSAVSNSGLDLTHNSVHIRTGSGLRTGVEEGEPLLLGNTANSTKSTTMQENLQPKDVDMVQKNPSGTSTGTINKKYMGDASKLQHPSLVPINSDDGSINKGSGLVVKGDKRGGVAVSAITPNTGDGHHHYDTEVVPDSVFSDHNYYYYDDGVGDISSPPSLLGARHHHHASQVRLDQDDQQGRSSFIRM